MGGQTGRGSRAARCRRLTRYIVTYVRIYISVSLSLSIYIYICIITICIIHALCVRRERYTAQPGNAKTPKNKTYKSKNKHYILTYNYKTPYHKTPHVFSFFVNSLNAPSCSISKMGAFMDASWLLPPLLLGAAVLNGLLVGPPLILHLLILLRVNILLLLHLHRGPLILALLLAVLPHGVLPQAGVDLHAGHEFCLMVGPPLVISHSCARILVSCLR